MSYDVYNDEYNPVTKSKKPDMGSFEGYDTAEGNANGKPPVDNFEYGSGGRDIQIVEPEDGVCEGVTPSYTLTVGWDSEDANDEKDPIQQISKTLTNP